MAQIDRMALKEAIKLLAFLWLVKVEQKNSVFYHNAWYKMGQRIGIDGKTFKKYISLALKEGLCHELSIRKSGKIIKTYKFVSAKNALSKLIGISPRQIHFIPLIKSKMSLQGVKEYLERCFLSLNLAGQHYKQNKHFPNKKNIMKKISETVSESRRTGRCYSNKARNLYKLLKNVDDILLESSKKHIRGLVTGCKHASKHIGVSTTTASKRIKNWIKEGYIKTQDIVYFTPVSSSYELPSILNNLKKQHPKAIHVFSRKEKGVKTISGKRVIEFYSPAFSYNTYPNDIVVSTFPKTK
ncbi:MAG: hypothetical protein E6Q24_20135 [Chitinophagaceae bacterium]|nr:MAG: hypothetical protein E6Q24_20135 [Chitinophagaceae bacterium]